MSPSTSRIIGSLALIIPRLLGGQCPAEGNAQDSTTSSVIRAVMPAELHNGRWGVAVLDRASGELLLACRVDEHFAPASTIKVLSAASVLRSLGATFRFQATVTAFGNRDTKGHFRGRLELDADGDPALGGRTLPGDRVALEPVDHSYPRLGGVPTRTSPTAGLDSLAWQLRRGGITGVRGTIAVTRTAGAGTAHINDDLVDLLIAVDAGAAHARVTPRPFPDDWQRDFLVLVDSTLDEPQVEARWRGTTLVVRGRVPRRAEPMLATVAADDPAALVESLFIDALRRAGIPVSPDTTLPVRPTPSAIIARLESPPLSALLDVTLHVSSNPWTRHLMDAAASRQGLSPLRLMRATMRGVIPPEAFVLRDVAGEDPANRVTPRAMATLLRAILNSDGTSTLEQHLARLGQDGTLVGAVPPGSAAWGQVRGKSGTLLTYDLLNERLLLVAKGFVGSGRTASGRDVVLAVYLNDLPLRYVEDIALSSRIVGQLVDSLLLAL